MVDVDTQLNSFLHWSSVPPRTRADTRPQVRHTGASASSSTRGQTGFLADTYARQAYKVSRESANRGLFVCVAPSRMRYPKEAYR